MESILSLIIMAILMVFTVIKEKKKRDGKGVINKPQEGFPFWRKKDESPKTSSKPNVPNKKFGRKSKKLPSHLESRSQAITRQTGTGNGRMENTHTRRTIALRLMEGDPVPRGYDTYVCHYCGAVNLVKHGARGKHSCYFCHDPID